MIIQLPLADRDPGPYPEKRRLFAVARLAMNRAHVLFVVRATLSQGDHMVSFVTARLPAHMADRVVTDQHMLCAFLLRPAGQGGVVASFAAFPRFLCVIRTGLKLKALRVRTDLACPHSSSSSK